MAGPDQDQFYDIYTFDKTRNQMIDELAALAGETGAADAAEVKELISMVQAEGLKNPGTGVTQVLGWSRAIVLTVVYHVQGATSSEPL